MCLTCVFHNSFRDLSWDGAPARESPDLDSDFQLFDPDGIFACLSSVLLDYSHRAGRSQMLGAADAIEPFEPGLYR